MIYEFEHIKQMVYALDRQIRLLDQWTDEAGQRGDYDCMFYEADAESLRQVRGIALSALAIAAQVDIAAEEFIKPP